jgi:transcriptional regulator with XRE-family HTH domain
MPITLTPMDIPKVAKFLNKKYFELQLKEERKITVEEFGKSFGVGKSLMTMWMNGARHPGPEKKKLIIDRYGREAIEAFDEDPDLYAVKEAWENLSPEARRSIREQAEQYASKNDTKRTSQKRRSRPAG